MGSDGDKAGSAVHWDEEVRVEDYSVPVFGWAAQAPFTAKSPPDSTWVSQAFSSLLAWSGELDLAPDTMYTQIKTGQVCILTGEPADDGLE